MASSQVCEESRHSNFMNFINTQLSLTLSLVLEVFLVHTGHARKVKGIGRVTPVRTPLFCTVQCLQSMQGKLRSSNTTHTSVSLGEFLECTKLKEETEDKGERKREEKNSPVLLFSGPKEEINGNTRNFCLWLC